MLIVPTGVAPTNYREKGIVMFESLLSKSKKVAEKAEVKSKTEAKKLSAATKGGGDKPSNGLLYGSIGLIVIGAAAIAFEALTSPDATQQQVVMPIPAKPAMPQPVVSKPATTSAPVSAVISASAPAASKPKPK